MAEQEIEKIFNSLQLDTLEKEKNIILKKFQKIQPAISKTSKYRDPKRLIPIIIYIYRYIIGHKINKSDLISVSQITSKEFNDFILQLSRYISREKKLFTRDMDIWDKINTED